MKTARILFLLAAGLLFSPTLVQAQADKPVVPLGRSAKAFNFKDNKIKLNTLLSPDVQIKGVNKNYKPEKWLEMEVENFDFTVNDAARKALNLSPNDQFLGPVVVSFYVHVKDPNPQNGKKTLLLLQKDITYIDVPINKATCFNVLISPATITRLTGGTGNLKFERMGYEVKYNGDIIYRQVGKGKNDWWNVESPSVAKDVSKTYPLLNKNETPFAMLWWDRYPTIKPVDSTEISSAFNKLQATEEDSEEEGTITPAPRGTGTTTTPRPGTTR